MSLTTILLLAALALVVVAVALPVFRALGRPPKVAEVVIKPTDETTIDHDGAVRSIAGRRPRACPPAALDEIWSPMHLERLARTYWRFLSRVHARADPRQLHASRALRRACSRARFDC